MTMLSYLISSSFFICLLCLRLQSFANINEEINIERLIKEIGGTMCKYLAMKNQIPRHFLKTCEDPTCSWDNWHDALAKASLDSKALLPTYSSHGKISQTKQRIILSYSHNGFGNQIWEHTVAFMIAESLKARMFISIIPDDLCIDNYMPPNTFAGYATMEKLLPAEFIYNNMPIDDPIRVICDNEPFFLSDRPRDWRNQTYANNFKSHLMNLLTDPKPRCIKLLGYYQNYPLCRDDVRSLWTPRMFSNFTMKPGENDLSIYLRCVPRHYHFNDKHFYEAILNHTTYDNIWLFQAPECPSHLSDNPSKDGHVASVIRLLMTTYKAKKWPSYIPPKLVSGDTPDDETAYLLHDLAGLTQSKKLILPASSWAFWAGMLSNATGMSYLRFVYI